MEAREEINDTLQAIKDIRAKEGDKRGVRGYIDCPACKEKESLFYTIASVNGHIWGKCKCGLGWMM